MDKRLGQVILRELDPPRRRKRIHIRFWMTGAPIPTAGYGGWVKTARPRRKSLTNWQGRDGLSIEFPFLIDDAVGGDADGREVEQVIRQLEILAAGEPRGDDSEPSLLQLRSAPGKLMPHGFRRARHNEWFIESLSWDRETIIAKPPAGRRIRAGGTLVVSQHVDDSRLEKLTKRNRGGRGGRRNWYKIKKGDTLQKIAARKDVYNDAKKWRLIAKANKIRDPKLGGGKDGAKPGSKWIGKKIRIPDPPRKGDKKGGGKQEKLSVAT